uniref:DNA-directed RNA polymerase III subunit RPC9 n=1 Tax=Mesocestoides corti TaxID=53468 RepID=A0A5K3EHH3_MESCO
MDTPSVDPRPLTNFEVYEFMKTRMESKDKVRAQQTLLYTGLKYFNERSPCTCQTSDEIASFISSMKRFDLTKSESLALINNCPTSQVELSVMIPELDTRFTMPQIDDILASISSAFPRGVEKASQIISSGVSEETT